MPFSYANPTSGPSAGGIGWFDFGSGFVINPGQTYTGLTGTLNGGYTVTFDLSSASISGAPTNFASHTLPIGPFFGNTQYTGTTGAPALRSLNVLAALSTTLTVSNIVVTDSMGNAVPRFTAILADAENTGAGEVWTWTTNGGNWSLFDTIGSPTPTLALAGGTATITGTSSTGAASYLLATTTPSKMTLNYTAGNQSSVQGFSLGFAVTTVTVQKSVGDRISSADQFQLNIGGTPTAQAITAGSANGLQTQTAVVYATPGSPYTISEAMAAGSASALSQYTVVTSAANATPAGTVPPTGTLPVTFTPVLGDEVTYTILNAAPETFLKTVDKAYADIGDVLTYTITVNNPNNFTVNNVLVTDATPAGTTYLGNLAVSAPFTGTAPASGITITSIGPDDAVTLSWQVQINSTPPVPTPITNFATVNVPNGTSGITNVVSTQIAHAFVSTLKTVDKANANVGDTLTYTVVLTNNGNATANNVVLTDPIPAGTTYVAASVTGSIPFTGTPATGLTLTAPIPTGGSATITYKVKVGASVPTTNPVANTASVAYAYTVDPAKPNSVNTTGTSNTVNTLVSNATLKTTKATDKTMSYIGDTITYQVAVTNTGNVPASNVILTDPVPNGTSYVAGSLAASVAFTGSPMTTIHLTNSIAPGETVSLMYQLLLTAIPNPNPIPNTVKTSFNYTVNPLNPNGVSDSSASNTVNTVVFKNNYSQEISDLIHSIALEEAAIGNIANAEGAKIQRMLAMGASPSELLCVNKSVLDMLEALGTLESVLKQKLSAVDCQISGTTIC